MHHSYNLTLRGTTARPRSSKQRKTTPVEDRFGPLSQMILLCYKMSFILVAEVSGLSTDSSILHMQHLVGKPIQHSQMMIIAIRHRQTR
jgi:hypothetical protein